MNELYSMRDGRGNRKYHSTGPYSGDRICTKIGLRKCCSFSNSLSSQIFFLSQRGNSDSPIQHAELWTESIDYCHLSEAYGSSRLELRRCLGRSVSLFASLGLRRDLPWSSPTRVVDRWLWVKMTASPMGLRRDLPWSSPTRVVDRWL